MSKIIVIEIDEQQDTTEQMRSVTQMLYDGFHTGLDKHARFEALHTVNHQTAKDTVLYMEQGVRANDVLARLHGRLTQDADVDQAIERAFEELNNE